MDPQVVPDTSGAAPPCPRCTAPMVTTGAPVEICSACGLQVPASARAELTYLDALSTWAQQRRAWVVDRVIAGEPLTGPAPATADAVAAPAPPRPATPATVGGCLLTAGAFALVAAGIVFTAFAWGSLGDIGRFALLVLAGLIASLAGWALSPRLPGAATTVAVVGTLLLAVASIFLLAQDDDGSSAVRTGVVVIAGVLGMVGARVQSVRQRGAAVLTGITASLLVLVAVAAAPSRGVVDLGDNDIWWVAACLFGWGVAMFVVDLVDRTAPWSWLGGAAIVMAILVKSSALITSFELFESDRSYAPALVSLILLLSAVVLLVVDRLTNGRWWSLVVASVVVLTFSTFAAATAAGDPSARPWSALALVAVAGVLLAGVAHVGARGSRGGADDSVPLHDVAGVASQASAWVVVGLLSLAVALACATWIDPPPLPPACSPFDCVATPRFAVWVDTSYPWWRGVLAGVAAVALAAIVGLALRRRRVLGGAELPVVAGVLATVLWIVTVEADAQVTLLGLDAVRGPIAAAAITAGLCLFGVIGLLRAPAWLVWVAALTVVVGIETLWPALAIDDWMLAPEVHGLLLAAPLLLAGMAYVLLEEPKHVSTWISVAPALTVLLLLPTLAVLDDTSSRWFSGVFGDQADPATSALVRSIALLVIGGVLAVLGARGRWAGVFWPGIAVVVVVAGAQLVDAASLLPYWVTLAVVGIALVIAGARWESVRLRGRRTRQWAGALH